MGMQRTNHLAAASLSRFALIVGNLDQRDVIRSIYDRNLYTNKTKMNHMGDGNQLENLLEYHVIHSLDN